MLFQGAGPDITPSARRRSGGSGGRLWDLLRRNANSAKDAMELAPGDTVEVPFDAVDDALRLQFAFGKGLCVVTQAFGDKLLPTDELRKINGIAAQEDASTLRNTLRRQSAPIILTFARRKGRHLLTQSSEDAFTTQSSASCGWFERRARNDADAETLLRCASAVCASFADAAGLSPTTALKMTRGGSVQERTSKKWAKAYAYCSVDLKHLCVAKDKSSTNAKCVSLKRVLNVGMASDLGDGSIGCRVVVATDSGRITLELKASNSERWGTWWVDGLAKCVQAARKTPVAQRDDSSDDERQSVRSYAESFVKDVFEPDLGGRARSRSPVPLAPTADDAAPLDDAALADKIVVNHIAAKLEAKRRKHVLKRGILQQKMPSTLGRSSYKKRFFELDDKKLMGFVDEADAGRPDAHPTCTWPLLDFVGATPSHNNEIDLAAATQGGADHTLRCDSSKERDAWVGIIDGAIRAARGASPSSLASSSVRSLDAVPGHVAHENIDEVFATALRESEERSPSLHDRLDDLEGALGDRQPEEAKVPEEDPPPFLAPSPSFEALEPLSPTDAFLAGEGSSSSDERPASPEPLPADPDRSPSPPEACDDDERLLLDPRSPRPDRSPAFAAAPAPFFEEPPSPPPAPADTPQTPGGWLLERAADGRAWRRRHFVLEGSILRAREKRDGADVSKVDVSSYLRVEAVAATDTNGVAFEFELVGVPGTLVGRRFRAATWNGRDAWLKRLRAAAALSPRSSKASPPAPASPKRPSADEPDDATAAALRPGPAPRTPSRADVENSLRPSPSPRASSIPSLGRQAWQRSVALAAESSDEDMRERRRERASFASSRSPRSPAAAVSPVAAAVSPAALSPSSAVRTLSTASPASPPAAASPPASRRPSASSPPASRRPSASSPAARSPSPASPPPPPATSPPSSDSDMRERRRERAASAERSAASSAAASPLIARPQSPAAPSPAASSSPSPARAAAKQAARERAPWPESQPPSPADAPTPPAAPSAPAPMPMPATPPAPMPATPPAPAPARLVSPASRRSHVTPAAQRTVDLDAAAAPTPAAAAPGPTRRCAGLLYTKAVRGDEPGTETWRLRWHAFDGNVLRWRDPEATEWLGAIRIGPNARCRRGASREDGYVALDVACDDWAATLLAPSRDERRRWLAALDPRPVPARPTPKKLVLKSEPRRRRPPPSESTPSPSSTDFEALLPLTHRERSRAAAVARAVDAYLATRSGRARKVVVEAARRSAPLADEVYCRLLLVCTDQAWELLGAVADCRAPSDAALCGVVREAAVGARVDSVVGAMDAALEAFSSAA